jgi:hypothetical protein
MPFIYRLESQDKGPVHINVSQISSITNSDLNSNWSVIQTADTSYVSYLSPEELVADILNSYNLTMKVYE